MAKARSPKSVEQKPAPRQRGKQSLPVETESLPAAVTATAVESGTSSFEATASQAEESSTTPLQQAGLWSDHGWTAKVIKNEEDDGWAVAMTLDGESEPALVGPWTMGRDKKNPKPLDAGAFATLVKTASEVIRRHEQQAHAALHKSTKVATAAGRVKVSLDIVPDEDQPYAELSAVDDIGTELARWRVPANFRFNHDVASAWVAAGLSKPEGADRD